MTAPDPDTIVVAFHLEVPAAFVDRLAQAIARNLVARAASDEIHARTSDRSEVPETPRNHFPVVPPPATDPALGDDR